MKKEYVTISRKWNRPNIEITVTIEDISLRMSMDDFTEALKAELETEGFVERIKTGVGPVTWVLRRETFHKKVDGAAEAAKETLHDAIEEAIERIISGVKEESAKVMGI